jgi:hypothetical protein
VIDPTNIVIEFDTVLEVFSVVWYEMGWFMAQNQGVVVGMKTFGWALLGRLPPVPNP